MTPNVLTSLIAVGVLFAAVGPFLLERLLTRRGEARLRLAERRIEEEQSGFVSGCGPVRRATPWDVLEAEQRLARTAWRARIISRPRGCRKRREARRALQQMMQAPVRRHPAPLHAAPAAGLLVVRLPEAGAHARGHDAAPGDRCRAARCAVTCAAMREWYEQRAAQIRRISLAPGVEMVFHGPLSPARQALLEAAGRELAAAVLASDLAAPARPDLTDMDGGRRGD